MKSTNFIGPKAFRQGFKTKKWQIEAKATGHVFSRENQSVPAFFFVSDFIAKRDTE
jgi:hypothetical protein